MTIDKDDRPPKRAPWFFDFMSGKEFTYPDTADEMAGVIDRIGFEAETWPDWRIEGGPYADTPIRLAVIERTYGKRCVIRAATDFGEAIFTAEPDPSGWIRITVTWQGETVFRAYLDHVYEQYGFWPPGAEPGQHDEEPGRFGKKMSWLALDTAVWPVTAPLAAEDGGLTLCERDQEFG